MFNIKSNNTFGTVLIFFILFLALFIFAATTFNFGTVDTTDYLGVAKGFADLSPTKMRSSHTWITGLFFGQFLKILPSIYFLKFVNVLLLTILGLLLYRITKSKKSILLFALSPVVWYNSPAINGLSLAAILMFAGYIFFKKFEEENRISNLVLSGLFWGLSNLFWDSSLLLFVFFVLVFFLKKEAKYLFIFLIAFFLTSSIRVVVDFLLFGFPLFSLIRYLGGQLVYVFWLGPYQEVNFGNFLRYTLLVRVVLFFAISPILFLIYRTNFKKYKKEFYFLILGLILFLLFGAQLRYLVVLLPFGILLLSDVIKKSELKWHVVLSVILFILLVPLGLDPHFNYNELKLIQEDANSIAKDFPNERFIAGETELHQIISQVYWGGDIKEIIGWTDYLISIGNKSDYLSYILESDSNINNERKLVITFSLENRENFNYGDVNYLITRDDKSPLKNFKLIKEYGVLRVYKRQN